jgi:hypothetical protein
MAKENGLALAGVQQDHPGCRPGKRQDESRQPAAAAQVNNQLRFPLPTGGTEKADRVAHVVLDRTRPEEPQPASLSQRLQKQTGTKPFRLHPGLGFSRG